MLVEGIAEVGYQGRLDYGVEFAHHNDSPGACQREFDIGIGGTDPDCLLRVGKLNAVAQSLWFAVEMAARVIAVDIGLGEQQVLIARREQRR